MQSGVSYYSKPTNKSMLSSNFSSASKAKKKKKKVKQRRTEQEIEGLDLRIKEAEIKRGFKSS